tara:strand:+ start:310 stop:510 length:201 start_codon:yes stop_codon:yes gene_type:complete
LELGELLLLSIFLIPGIISRLGAEKKAGAFLTLSLFMKARLIMLLSIILIPGAREKAGAENTLSNN